mmetsp:Transcript_40851/g.29492  ORF Transcript_40851/g.29492 Transcript_40851/m.29492 type:complete len:157 (-) Transcript_40851:1124-1594(-)
MTRSKIQGLLMWYLVGYAIGGIMYPMPDKYGRRKSIFFTSYFHSVAQFFAIILSSYNGKLIAMIFMGVFHMKMSISYCYLFELVHRRNKVVACSVINLVDCLPMTVCSLYLMFVSNNLNTLLLATSAICMFANLLLFLIPETPAWLLTQGKRKKTI